MVWLLQQNGLVAPAKWIGCSSKMVWLLQQNAFGWKQKVVSTNQFSLRV